MPRQCARLLLRAIQIKLPAATENHGGGGRLQQVAIGAEFSRSFAIDFFRRGCQHGDRHIELQVTSDRGEYIKAVATGHFREDLFFRLNVVSICMPPLRERREEIPLFVRHFLSKYSAHYNRPGIELSPATLESFLHYDWPGNVRELENVIQRIVILGPDSPAATPLMPRRGERRSALRERRQSPRLEPLPPPVAAAPPPPPDPVPPLAVPVDGNGGGDLPSLKLIGRNAARAAERELMLRMLHRTRWNRKEAAQMLGISYKALLYKIKEHRLDDPLTDPLPPRHD